MSTVILFFMGLITMSSAYADSPQQAIKQGNGFDTFNFNAFQNAPSPSLHSLEMRRYVSEATLKRLNIIDLHPESDIFNFDYSTYSQDDKSAWIPVDNAGPMKIDLVGDTSRGDVV